MKTIGGKIISLFLSLLLLCAHSVNCVAQGSFAGSHLSKFIGISDGLPSNFVDDIMFDDAGFMWVATSGGGLCRYDGYEFIVMATGTEKPLKSNFVRNVVEDGFHRMWIGTEWGIEVFDLMNSCMVSVPGTEDTAFELFNGGSCAYMTLDSKGCVWAKTGSTLVRIEFDDAGSALRVDSLADPRMEQPAMVFKDVENNGAVWMGMGGIIYRIRCTDDGLVCAPALPGFIYNPESLVTDYIIKDQDVWISTIDGLFRYNLPTGLWKLYTTDPGNDKSLSQNYISGLALTSDNTLVAISLKGANFYRPIDDSFERLSSDSDTEGCSLSSNFLNCVSVRGDDVWFGTESAGLIQLKTKRLAVNNYRHQSSDAASIASNPVNAVYQTPDGMLWVGTVESGLSYTMNPKEGFRHITAKKGGISHNSVSAVTSDDKGNLWVGTWGGGVDVLSGASPYDRVLKPVWRGSQSDRIDHVGALELDTVNNLMWIGCNTGIYYCDLSSYNVYSAFADQTTGCVGSCIDTEGQLWIGSQNGVHVVDLKSARRNGDRLDFDYVNLSEKLDEPGSGVPDKIVSIIQAKDGTIWLGSNGNGIYKTEESLSGDLSFRNISMRDGLISNVVRCIEEDEWGNIWISTGNGLSMLSPGSMQFLNYSVEQGLLSSQFYLNASCVCADGSLCFGTVDGLSVIEPSRSSYQYPPLNLHITKTSVNGNVNYSPYTSSMTLHERDRSLVFSFSTLNYATNSRFSYMYRIEGLDSRWYKVGYSDNTITYPSLPAGDYLLQVKAMGAPGSAADMISLPIHVKPYFRHTILAKLLLLFVVWGIILVWHKRRTRFLVKQKELLQRTVDERTREINNQRILIEQKAEELDRQNAVLKHEIEELAGNRLIIALNPVVPENSRDDDFKSKVMEVLKGNYSNPDLDVALFCDRMGMSKTSLNKKLQESMGHSVTELIRTYRLTVAHEMIVNNRQTGLMNISEIAYECGFNDPKYFTRCFSKEFGVAPSSV